MNDFRSHLNSNPDIAQALPQMIATNGLNNQNTYDKLGKGYDKIDNGNIENLLGNMQYYQRAQTKDTQIGLGNVSDGIERQLDKFEELMDNLKGDDDENSIK